MSTFTRKVLTLKQCARGYAADGNSVSGIIKAERLGATVSFTFSGINFAPLTQGRYALIIGDNNGKYEVFLTDNPPICQTFTANTIGEIVNGFAAAVIADCDECTAVAFGSLLTEIHKQSEYTNHYAQNYKKKNSDSGAKEARIFHEDKEQCEIASGDTNTGGAQSRLTEIYDDEAVATENYYGEEISPSSYHTNGGKLHDDISNSVNNIEWCNHQEAPQKKTSEDIFGNETCNGSDKSGSGNFFSTIADDFDRLFASHTEINSLSALVPNSRWVKVRYANDKYYVVGIISENNNPTWIVYGVPGKHDSRPRGFERYTAFLPESHFSCENGYWCMFQDASTGETRDK